MDVGGCARCGLDHAGLVFRALVQPAKVGLVTLTHWVPCPANGEPILAFVPRKRAA